MIHINLRRLCISLALGSVIALSSFSVASADGPVVTGPVHRTGSDVVGNCGSFLIIDNWEADFVGIRFYDDTGHIERVVLQLTGTDTFTNSVTGKAYSGTSHETLIVDFRGQPGTGTVDAGATFRLTVPGVGTVVLNVGVFLYVKTNDLVIVGGPHQIQEGDLTALCAVLA